MSNILVPGDLHCPWQRAGYLQFLIDLYYQWNCDEVIFIGDVVDMHAVSFFNTDPGCPSGLEEYIRTKEAVAKFYKAFPKATVVLGNHDKRVVRKARSADIHEVFIKSYADIWETPGWDWVEDCIRDDIYFYHGDGQGGEYPAANAVRKMLMSVVMGHNHTASGIKYYSNPTQRFFALDTGAGCDDRALAFAYAGNNKRKSVLSAAVIIDGTPYLEPMLCGKGEPYWDGNFK